MAGNELIEAHLAALSRTLPARIVDELADGLAETWHRHLASGLPPAQAARAAIAEFGTPAEITRAFVTQAHGRRAALMLLATGPVAAACWGSTLAASHAWTWPVPAAAVAVLGAAMMLAVGTLLAAATSQRSYRRTRLAGVGGVALIGLDIAVPAGVLLSAPSPGWPMLGAVAVSLARVALTVRLLAPALTG